MSAMNEMSLRPLADAELSAISGGHGHHHHHHGHPSYPSYKSVSQSNSIGEVEVFAFGNKGDITVQITQSNAA